jgi:predicted small lipoprotein YifL
MIKHLLTAGLMFGLCLTLSGCGKRGKLDAPPGAAANAPDLSATKPFPKPIGNGLPTPTSTPGQVP